MCTLLGTRTFNFAEQRVVGQEVQFSNMSLGMMVGGAKPVSTPCFANTCILLLGDMVPQYLLGSWGL